MSEVRQHDITAQAVLQTRPHLLVDEPADTASVTVNPTNFVADRQRFAQLGATVLPELLQRGGPLRVWSAGSSLVFEPYSLASMLSEQAPDRPHAILTTDSDERMLRWVETRSKGISLRTMLSFVRHDLLRDPCPEGLFDLVLYRNALSSVADEAREEAYRRLAGVLRLGGVLLSGATEVLPQPMTLGLMAYGPGLYRKVRAA